MPKLFVSHSSRNNAEAAALGQWLAREGWGELFLDFDPKQGIAAGERWTRALVEAARRCEAVLFLLSRDWLASQPCQNELSFARGMNKSLFGILIEPLPESDIPASLAHEWQLVSLVADADPETIEVDLPKGGGRAKASFSREGLLRLSLGLRRAGFDPSFFAWPPPADPGRAPYRGLKPLEAEDAGIFFGREASTIEALDRMRALRQAAPPRFLCVLGASGSGKSSFLRAGLSPRLARDDRAFLALPVLRPERAAIGGRSGLLAVLEGAVEARGLPYGRADLRAAIAGGAETVRPILRRLLDHAVAPLAGTGLAEGPDGETGRPPLLVLPIDQGEELFAGDGQEGSALLTLLRELMTGDDPAVAVLMAIRSDWFERVQLAPELDGISPETLTFGAIPKGVYATIIEGPAARLRASDRRLEIDPALTGALLADMGEGGGRDALPLLAFTLERLWLEYGQRGRLALADYHALGGVRGSIEAAVAEALAQADKDPRIPRDGAARLTLLRRGLVPWLAGIDPDTGSPRRRVARISEIPAEARPLVDLLVEERLLSTDTDPATGEATVEPAHEALLRQWGTLQGWLEEDFGALATLEGVRRAARDWGANARSPAWLAHGGERLAEAEQLSGRPDLSAQLGPAERDYLAACRARADRLAADARGRARMRRTLQWGSVAAALIFAVLSVVSWEQRQEAMRLRGVAEERTIEAQRQTEIARERTAEAERQTEIARERTAEAVRQADIAREREEDARQAKVEARKNRMEAEESGARAEESAKRAERALSAAKEAVKNLVLRLAHDLKGRGVPLAMLREVLTRAAALVQVLVTSNADDPELLDIQAMMYSEFVDTYMSAGDLAAAQNAAERSVAIGERRYAERSDDERARNLAVALVKLGDVLRDRSDGDGALALYERSLEIREKLAAKSAGERGFSVDLALVLERIGDVYWYREDLDAALARYERSLAVHEKLVAAEPDDFEFNRGLCFSLDRVGDVLVRRDRGDEALALFKRGLSIRERLLAIQPHNTSVARETTLGLNKIGDLLKNRGQLDEALDYFDRALTIRERLAAEDEKNATFARDLALSLGRVGEVLMLRGRREEALASFERALRIVQRLFVADPSNVGLARDIAVALRSLALLERELGRPAEACRRLQAALAVVLPFSGRVGAPEIMRYLRRSTEDGLRACEGGKETAKVR